MKSQLIRTKALAIIETRYRSEPAHELSFGEYFKTGHAAIEWDEAKVESARIVLLALAREYVAVGKSGREFSQIMGEELEGACNSLELSIPQRDLLSLEIEDNRRSLTQTPTLDPVQERIRAGLLRIHSKRLERAKFEDCLREAYDVCAREFTEANEPMTEELLSGSIPVIVFHAAVEHKWVPYPPVRWIRGGGNMLEGWLRPSRYEPLQQSELTETFGRYKVNPGYTDAFKKYLESRIIYWRAEALKRAAEGGFPKADFAGGTKSGGTETAQGQPAKVTNGADRGGASWQAIEISFLSDERVQIRTGAKTETYNYGELGFADRRARQGTPKPNQAWGPNRTASFGTRRRRARLGRRWRSGYRRYGRCFGSTSV